MNNEVLSNEHNNSTEQMDMLNIPNGDVCMEQKSENQILTAHDHDNNGGKSRNRP